ncbi:MAG: 16S rRNA (guanine(966)-N(2))-methyltransferase RsmD [Chlamydiae bacterium]|nr:16S rRNA (guanine(966)-N(2))-methyltransferase RsmD [Chlamydiota bacterium]
MLHIKEQFAQSKEIVGSKVSLRVIGGRFKNRLLFSPKGKKTRPSLALCRKAVFDICKEIVKDGCFLDLYAGTGAMGIEALSRGAKKTVFVETDPLAIQTIYKNVHLLELDKNVEIIKMDAHKAINRFMKEKRIFDLIYIDPPYVINPYPLLKIIDESAIVAKDGMVFLEEAALSKWNLEMMDFSHLTLLSSRKFGRTILLQYIPK